MVSLMGSWDGRRWCAIQAYKCKKVNSKQLELPISEMDSIVKGDIEGVAGFLDHEVVKEIMGPDVGAVIVGAFKLMEAAEEEIQAAMKKDPQNAELIDERVFQLCRPSEALREYPEHMYRKHVQELIARVVAGEDTTLATDAEAACGLAGASMIAPFGRDAQHTYIRIFLRLFPGYEFQNGSSKKDPTIEKLVKLWRKGDYQEEYPGHMNELESYCKRKLSQDWRVYKPRKQHARN